jgi:fibronectin-binding autotransporter adhesin
MKNLVRLLSKTSLLTALAVLPMSAQADLTWGTGGAGGAGTWNDVNTNWWDGASNVVWSPTRAIFAGTAGTVTVSGTQAATGLSFNTASYLVQGGAIEFASTGTISMTPTGLTTINSSLVGSNGLVFAGIDTSRTFVIGGNNTGLSGPITLSSGILRLTNSNALGTSNSGANGLTTAAGTVLQLASGVTLDKAVTVAGPTSITAYTGNSVMTGTLTLNGSTTFTMDATNTMTLSGAAGLGRTGSTVQVVGTGTMIINTAAAGSTAYGMLLRGSSVLQINVANALGATTMTMGDSTFGLSGTTSPTIALNGVTLTNTVVLENVTTNRIISNIASGTTSTFSGNVVYNKNTDITLASKAADGKLVMSGNITDGSFTGTVKIGSSAYANAGTVELSRAAGNNYDGGTEVNSGTLLISNTAGSATGTGAVAVNSGATLIGGGIITGAVTVNSGGTISGGETVGVLRTGNLSVATGSLMAVQINSITAGTGYDQISVTGSVTLGGNLGITLGFTPVEDSLFFVLLNDGTDAVTGTLSGLSQGDIFNMAGATWMISYEGDSATNSFTGGNDVVLQAVPEPSVVALIGVAAAGLVGVRRRSRASRA